MKYFDHEFPSWFSPHSEPYIPAKPEPPEPTSLYIETRPVHNFYMEDLPITELLELIGKQKPLPTGSWYAIRIANRYCDECTGGTELELVYRTEEHKPVRINKLKTQQKHYNRNLAQYEETLAHAKEYPALLRLYRKLEKEDKARKELQLYHDLKLKYDTGPLTTNQGEK